MGGPGQSEPAPEKRVSSCGTGRRLRALYAIGHPIRCLTRPHKLRISGGKTQPIPASLAAFVARMYVLLEQYPDNSPEGLKRQQHAAEMGWPPPIAWDDDTIDDPRTGPAHRAVNTMELSENADVDLEILLSGALKEPGRYMGEGVRRRLMRRAVETLDSQLNPRTCLPWTISEIAAQLGCNERSVTRCRADAAAAAAEADEAEEVAA